MAITREELWRKLYYRVNGDGRKLYKCRKCGDGPMSICVDCVSSEPCLNEDCGAVDWRELTEDEFLSDSTLKRDLQLLPSDYLSSKIGDLYASEADWKEWEEWRKLFRKLLEGLDGFGDEATAEWLNMNTKENPIIIESILDEFYTRDFLKEARKMVDRTMKLTAMVPKATPDNGVNIYLREATRSYVAGHWASSVALSRSTLEFALRQRLKEKAGSLPRQKDDTFENLLIWATQFRLIEDAHVKLAEQVRQNGNEVIHKGSQSSEDRARHILVCTRGVLDHLYSK